VVQSALLALGPVKVPALVPAERVAWRLVAQPTQPEVA